PQNFPLIQCPPNPPIYLLFFTLGPRSVDAFKEVDQDADKVLTRTEVKEHLKLSYEKGGKVHDDLYYEKILDDIFYKSDRDKDGMISAKEYNIYEHDEL
uniref:peptidylprolyl isomerase n=1 Tax=Cynoglossus semilaevis TaxID=244447 RepID=A0A3P8WE33_CYNSE